MNNSAIALLLKGLTPEQQQELIDISDYLAERADPDQNPHGLVAEGSIASVLNKASPPVREKLSRLVEALQTPRFAPFQPERSEAERAEEFGLHPERATTVLAALDGQHVLHGLQQRMGTDSQLPRTPPSMADLLAAAYDKHSGGK